MINNWFKTNRRLKRELDQFKAGTISKAIHWRKERDDLKAEIKRLEDIINKKINNEIESGAK